MKALIEQSFQIFNIYGKKAESVEDILQGFFTVLQGYDTEIIRKAFTEWMGESATFPTPADIKKLCAVLNREAAEACRYDDLVGARKAEPGAVQRAPWAFMTHRQIVNAGLMDRLKKHIASLGAEQGEEYIKYLRSWCEFPQSWPN